jgi:sec-independent protein translocase protein TatB
MGGAVARLNDATRRFRSQVQLVDSPAMFNLSGSEIVFLLLLALIVLGPEKLPDAVRRFGKAYAEFKKMSTGFQSELKSALDEPMREMRETADAFKNAVNFDFVEDDETTAAHDTDVTDTDTDTDVTDTGVTDTDVTETVEDPKPAEQTADAVAEPAEIEPADPETKPPIVRPPGPTFHSAAPQQPKAVEAVEVVDAVEESASE